MASHLKTFPLVVKVGGSLLDLPDFGPRLRRWLETLGPDPVLLVPGGGPAADLIRRLDRLHRLGDEHAHWLALQTMTLNAHVLLALLPHARLIEDVERSRDRQGQLFLLDAYEFARADELRPDHLPHSWDVTSDSVAARAAVLAGARKLVLLKSVSIPKEIGRAEAGRRGYVDPFFAEVIGRGPAVEVVNLRDWQPAL